MTAETVGLRTAPGDAEPFKVVSIVSTFNEGDIISATLSHLIRNGISVYMLDNESTDDTVEQARRWLGRGLINIETFPQVRDPMNSMTGYFPWRDLLRRKEQLARELEADWFLHQDADEIRESPWPECSFAQAIERVHESGYNAIGFEVFNFRPVDDGFKQGDDPAQYFSYYEPAEWFDQIQLKGWRADVGPVQLAATGGHAALFADCRVFPIKFIMRHYPIRGAMHGRKKVFQERRGRFLPGETLAGWHRQYDRFSPSDRFLWDKEQLEKFNAVTVRSQLMRMRSRELL